MNLKITKKILDAYKSDNREACELIFTNYYERTKSYLYHLTKNSYYAEELAQEAFITLWEKRAAIESPDKLISFLNSITRNITLNYYRQKRNNILISTDDFAVVNTQDSFAENDYLNIENDLFFETMVSGMPKMQRKVFLMYRMDGLSAPEIAKKLGISQSTVENHIYQATKHAKEIVGLLILLFFQIK